ncbi:acyl-CoA dehydrogenase family protein [Myxococcota bacterium]|nr:acyl-CoA dehydrogenase family protein [Myxococcota bacterium]
MAHAPRIPERDALLAAVDGIRDVVQEHADEAERLRCLAKPTVEALTRAGIFSMLVPRELGGLEADPVTQMEVIERLAWIDPSAGWCGFIGAGTSAFVAGTVPEGGLREILSTVEDGSPWVCVAGSPAPAGQAERVEGGYRISGRWGWASGIHHSTWVLVGSQVTDGQGEALPPIVAVVPKCDLEVEDTWHVAGLKGTGSTHFNAQDLFVPDHRTMGFPQSVRQRGGELFRLPVVGFFGPAFAGFPQGVGRRALDVVIELAARKVRVMASAEPLSHRPVFQRDLARADGRLRAARALVVEALTELWDRLHDDTEARASDVARMLYAFSENAEAAAEAVDFAYKYGGGDALFEDSMLQRCKRDMHAATQHMLVGEYNYEYTGKALLGIAELNPVYLPAPRD